MSSTLGEKLRQAREQRGFTLSEVAEQTRISPLYLESIENDDYSILPGGIFNKGFVKSFAKFVGVNEQEALADYASLINQGESGQDEQKVYRPQVLTDEGTGRSMIPTVVIALVILGVMTGAILLLLRYLQQPSSDVAGERTPSPAANASPAEQSTPGGTLPASDTPAMADLKVEFGATTEPVSISATVDGSRSTKVLTPGSTETFTPKESLRLSYSRSLAQFVQLTINGRRISTPTMPSDPRRSVIEFDINKDNLSAIWADGAIGSPATANQGDANTSGVPASTPGASAVRSTPAPRPAANANTPAVRANTAASNTRSNPTPRTAPTPSVNRP